MSAIALRRFDGWARELWRPNRNPLAVKVLKLLYGRSRNVTIEPVAVGRDTGTVEYDDQPGQSDRFNCFPRNDQRRAQCSRVGGATLEPNGSCPSYYT